MFRSGDPNVEEMAWLSGRQADRQIGRQAQAGRQISRQTDRRKRQQTIAVWPARATAVSATQSPTELPTAIIVRPKIAVTR